jgi:hypothetical protein
VNTRSSKLTSLQRSVWGILEYVEANRIIASSLVLLWALTSAVAAQGLLMTSVRNGPDPPRIMEMRAGMIDRPVDYYSKELEC